MKKVLLVMVMAGVLSLAASAYGGDVDVQPYGFILVNANYNSHIDADIPVKVALNDTLGNFLITPRQTRFGLKMSMSAGEWDVSGKIELDFWGLKGSGANGGVMQSAPRSRLAYFQLKKDDIALSFGQRWVFFAPLSPASIAHVSIPEFSSCGNLWNRMPQLRFDYKTQAGETGTVFIQAALLRPLGADVSPARTQGDQLGAGEFSQMPFVHGRFSFSSDKKVTVGVSGHFGQEDFYSAWNGYAAGYELKDEKTTTMAVAGDVKGKVDMVTLSGEGFFGQNLRMLFSNAHLRSEAASDGRKIEGVEVVGGWGQVSISPPSETPVTINAGAGIEILKEEHVDSLIFDPIFGSSKPLWKNFTFFGNVMVKPINRVTIALEINYIKTTYKCLDSGSEDVEICEEDADNTSANIAFKFDF
jgi:hypothetical protein